MAELISWPSHLPAMLRANQRGDLFVRCARAKRALHVVLLDGEEAIAQLAIGGQAQPVAVEAERAAHGRDETYRAAAIGVPIFGGGGARVGIGHWNQRRDLAREGLDDRVRQQHFRTVPQALRIERHELDVAHFEAVLPREAGQRNDIRLNQILHRDGVELDFGVSGALGGGEAGEHARQVVAARDAGEAFTVECIDVDVQAAQPGLIERRGEFFQQHAVGGEGQIANPGDGCEAAHQHRQIAAQERLAASEAQLCRLRARRRCARTVRSLRNRESRARGTKCTSVSGMQ